MSGNSRGKSWNGKRGSFGKGNNSNGPGEKKFKGDDDMDEDGFDSQLAAMIEDADEMQHDTAMIEEPEELVEDMEVSRITRWKRPIPPPLDPTQDKLQFQQIDIDHYIGKPIPGMPGAKSGPVPIMRMFGVTDKVNIPALFFRIVSSPLITFILQAINDFINYK